MSDNRSCKAYKEKPNIDREFYLNVSVNCANCTLWNGERCSNEGMARSVNELTEFLRLCDW